jgi:outer membrane protein TolC
MNKIKKNKAPGSRQQQKQLYCFLSCLILLFIGPTLPAQQLQQLSLEDFLAQASGQSLQSDAAERDLALAKMDFEIFRGSLKPQINAFANIPNYVKTSSEITQPDGTVRFQAVQNNNSALGLSLNQTIPGTGGVLFFQSNLQRFDDFESNFSLYNGLPFRLGLSQSILGFNPVKWQRQLAPLQIAEAKQQYAADLADLRVSGTQLYFDLLLAVRESEIADTNFFANQRLYEIAEERFELGKISRRDLLQLELELLAAQRGQLAAKQAVSQASAAVANFIGQSGKVVIYFPLEPAETAPIVISEQEALALAHKNRPEWIAYSRRLLEANRSLAEAQRTSGPSIELTAAFGRTRSSMELADIYQDAQPEAFVQLQINVPILDWGQRRNRVAQAKTSQAFTASAIEQEQLELENQVQQTLRAYNSLQAELALARQIRGLAEERFRITTESYVLGAIPLADLTLAQREKDQSERTYVATLRAYFVAQAELKRLTLIN